MEGQVSVCGGLSSGACFLQLFPTRFPSATNFLILTTASQQIARPSFNSSREAMDDLARAVDPQVTLQLFPILLHLPIMPLSKSNVEKEHSSGGKRWRDGSSRMAMMHRTASWRGPISGGSCCIGACGRHRCWPASADLEHGRRWITASIETTSSSGS
jgi:hypothetical protein